MQVIYLPVHQSTVSDQVHSTVCENQGFCRREAVAGGARVPFRGTGGSAAGKKGGQGLPVPHALLWEKLCVCCSMGAEARGHRQDCSLGSSSSSRHGVCLLRRLTGPSLPLLSPFFLSAPGWNPETSDLPLSNTYRLSSVYLPPLRQSPVRLPKLAWDFPCIPPRSHVLG